MLRNFIRDFKQILLNYRSVYYHDYIRRVLLAHVLNLRCPSVTKEKKRIIRKFVGLEFGISALALEVLKNKIFQKGRVTVGNDVQLLKSVLSTKLINYVGRLKQHREK